MILLFWKIKQNAEYPVHWTQVLKQVTQQLIDQFFLVFRSSGPFRKPRSWKISSLKIIINY